jgi:UDP-glucose-4-epimerase
VKKILIVGGAGYIGSHVARAFLDKQHAVTVYDNLSSGCRENIFPESRFVLGDILDYGLLLETMKKGFDGIVHLAAFKAAGESMLVPEKYSINNLNGTVHILNAACEAGIRNIVFSSSAAVFGAPVYVPIDEKHPTEPINYYGFTKLEIERLLGWYDRLKNLKYAALRYFNAAGYDVAGRVRGLEKNPANLLPIVMEVAAGIKTGMSIYGDDYDTPDGTCIRDYIHVNDLADAHVRAFEYLSETATSIALNLGSEHGISVKTMIDTARAVTGRPIKADVAPRRPGDPARLIASAAKALSVLKWKACLSDAKTLLESTWNVYKKFEK